MGKEATQFRPGQSGNPHGRPRGTTTMRTRLLNALKKTGRTEQQLLDKVFELAAGGDAQALSLVAERLWQRPRPVMEPVKLHPQDDTPESGATAILAALMAGRLGADQAATAMQVVRSAAEVIELGELRSRLEALEAQ